VAWGWRRGGGANAPTAPRERDRREWLSSHGITPMNRSTRLWDMEVTPPKWMKFHYIERVGSFDRARRALDLQRGGTDFPPIKWEGSRDMATGRAYDWCYCIEAVRPEVDGRTACKCQCVDCKEGEHFRKRRHASRIRGQMVRHRNATRYGWRGFRTRWENRWGRWCEFWHEVHDEGLWATLNPPPDETLDLPLDEEADPVTPQFDRPPEWYTHQRNPEDDEDGRT